VCAFGRTELCMQPFVGVTCDYLISCDAVVYVVETPQRAMGQYPAGSCACIEAENLDAAETFSPEWFTHDFVLNERT
jgi:hypothetical protein